MPPTISPSLSTRQLCFLTLFVLFATIPPSISKHTAVLKMTIYDWTSNVCCTMNDCPKDCSYDFMLCFGASMNGQCVFLKEQFVIPHAVPERYGQWLIGNQPFVRFFEVPYLPTNNTEILHIEVNVHNNPSVKVLIKETLLDLHRDMNQVTEKFHSESGSSTLKIGFELSCAENYYGRDCEKYCRPPSPWEHHTCDEYLGIICLPGYAGDLCDPVCEEDCGKYGTCAGPNKCMCESGWMGPKCEQCEPSQGCATGQCIDGIPGTCKCAPNYGGDTCEIQLDICRANPGICQNGGICMGSDPKHICRCPEGYSGQHCQIVEIRHYISNAPRQSECSIVCDPSFCIFIVLGIVIGCFAIYVTKTLIKRKRKAADYVACQRRDLEALERAAGEEDPKSTPPAYHVKQLSAIELTQTVTATPAPPTYDEAISQDAFKTRPAPRIDSESASSSLRDLLIICEETV